MMFQINYQDDLANTLLSLPVFEHLNEKDIEYISIKLKNFLKLFFFKYDAYLKKGFQLISTNGFISIILYHHFSSLILWASAL